MFVYFKVEGNDRIMVILNNNSEVKFVNLRHYKDQLKGIKEIKDLTTGEIINITVKANININGESGNLYQLIK